MLQTYANVAWIINLIVVQVAVDVSPKATYGVRVDGDVRQDNLVTVVIFLYYIRANVVEEWKIFVQFEDVMVAFDQD